MEGPLLHAFDAVVARRGSTRSEVLRDLARAEVTRAEVAAGGDAVATVTLVYDHHVRDLTERLTALQHALGAMVRSTMHVHLDHAHCLEVTILQGPAAELQRFAERVFATRGVKHGGIEMVASGRGGPGGLHVHVHSHDDPYGHGHDHDHVHDDDDDRGRHHGHAHGHRHDHRHETKDAGGGAAGPTRATGSSSVRARGKGSGSKPRGRSTKG